MSARLLVAGVGNIFLADDAFGPEVIRALDHRPLPPGVRVRDFGIRGMDLAYELLDGYDTAVLVDAAVRGHAPGTLSLIEPEPPGGSAAAAPPEAHGMDTAKVLAHRRLLRRSGTGPFGCQGAAGGTGRRPVGGGARRAGVRVRRGGGVTAARGRAGGPARG
ncbi:MULTISPECIES: hydrogenase maturation protease [Streptomyces]|uniref:hydrogenase maturation protease n=1 Tax=Streptomyces TaxID=1883 RepID=UPI00049F979F|nr:hypothetical protein DF19_28845 [Streptomyces olindensis]